MPESSRRSPSDRKSWRPAPETEQLSPGVRRVRRFAATSLAIGLFAVLMWLLILWIIPRPQLVVACMSIGDYDALQLPPIPFWEEDRTAFGTLSELTRDPPPSLSDREKLAAWAGSVHARDSVVLYVSAHGLAVDGKPAVAYSHFQPGSQTQHYKISDLLADLSKSSPAGTKLLLLDVGRTPPDPRLGIVVNDFPKLVEEEVKQIDDPSLWVILSNGMFEKSHVCHGAKRSVFAFYVTEGLNGAARNKQENNIDLAGYFGYLRDRVGGWVWENTKNARLPETQTPQLLRGHDGLVTNPAIAKEVILISSLPKRETAASTTTTPATALEDAPGRTGRFADSVADAPRLWKLTANRLPTGLLAAGVGPVFGESQGSFDVAQNAPAPAATPVPAPATTVTTATPAPTTPTPATPATTATTPAATGTTTPGAPKQPPPAIATSTTAATTTTGIPATTGTAPAPAAATIQPGAAPDERDDFLQFLRKKQADADMHDARGWGASDYSPLELRAYQKSLSGYYLRAMGGKGFVTTELRDQAQPSLNESLRRIKNLEQDFTRGGARASYERDSDIAAAVRTRNRLLFDVPEYIRWYGLSNAAWGDEAAHGQLRDLIGHLKTMNELFEDASAAPGIDSDNPAATTWRTKLVAEASAVEALERPLRAMLAKQVDDLFNRSESPHATTEQAFELLSISLLTPDQRAKLVEVLRRKLPGMGEVPQGVKPGTQPDPTGRAKKVAELEVALAALADRTPSHHLPEALRELQGVSSSSGEEGFRQACRKLGDRLRGCYESSASAVRINLQADLWKNWRAAETIIRLADVRDKDDIQRELDKLKGRPWLSPVAGIPLGDFQPQGTLQIVFPQDSLSTPDEPISLETGAPRKVKWTIRAVGRKKLPAIVRLRLDYDSKKLQISDARGQPLLPDFDERSTNPGDKEAVFEYQLTSKSDDGAIVSVLGNWEYDRERPQPRETKFRVPEPRFLGILVEGQIGTLKTALTDPEPTRLTDPNKPNWIRVHPSAKDGTTRLKVQPFSSGQTEFNLALQNASTQPRKFKYSLHALRKTDERDPLLNLPPRELQWTAAQPVPPHFEKLLEQELTLPANGTIPLPLVPAPAAPPKEGAKEPPPAAKPAAAASDEPGKPLNRYLIALFESVARPDDRQALILDIEPLNPDRYLQPTVSYRVDEGEMVVDVEPIDPEMLPPTGAQIEWLESEGIDVSQGDSKLTIKPGQKGPFRMTQRLAPDPKRIVSVRLTADGYPRTFLYDVPLSTLGRNAERKQASLQELRIVSPTKESELMFPEKDRLEIQLEADAPPDAADLSFHLYVRSPQSQVEQRFDHDREYDLRLVSEQESPPGALRLKTAVRDLKANLPVGGFHNQKVIIRAALEARQRDGGDATERKSQDIQAIFDKRLPHVKPVQPLLSVTEGQNLEVEIQADDDLSGIDKVEAAFDRDDKKKDDLKSPKLARLVAGGDGNIYRVTFKADDLKPLGTGRNPLYLKATDRVGNPSPIVEMTVQVNEKPPPPPPEKLAKTNKVEGTVIYFREPVKNATVTLADPATIPMAPSVAARQPPPTGPTVTTDNQGHFVFKDVRPGQYRLIAKGTIKNQTHNNLAAPITVQVEAPPADPPAPVQIDLK